MLTVVFAFQLCCFFCCAIRIVNWTTTNTEREKNTQLYHQIFFHPSHHDLVRESSSSCSTRNVAFLLQSRMKHATCLPLTTVTSLWMWMWMWICSMRGGGGFLRTTLYSLQGHSGVRGVDFRARKLERAVRWLVGWKICNVMLWYWWWWCCWRLRGGCVFSPHGKIVKIFHFHIRMWVCVCVCVYIRPFTTLMATVLWPPYGFFYGFWKSFGKH